MDTTSTALLTYIALPTLFYYYNRKTPASQDDRQMALFALSLALGVLTGYLLADRAFGFLAPPAFLLPAVTGTAASIAGPKFAQNRKIYLGATVGGAVGIYLALGILTAQFGLLYLAYVALLAVATFANLQILLGKAKAGGRMDLVQSQLTGILSSVLVQSVALIVLGYSVDRQRENARLEAARLQGQAQGAPATKTKA